MPPTGAVSDDADLPVAGGELAQVGRSRTDVTDSAQYALQWLAEAVGVKTSICLVKPAGEDALVTVAAHGLLRG